MPVYNCKKYVSISTDCILAQTFGDFEFIVIDDGSTDGSLAVLKRLADRDKRIRLVSRPNTGIVVALNEGLALAAGAYIARMDADDLCDRKRFELQLERLEREPELVAVGSCALSIDPEGEPLGPAPVPLTHEEIEAKHLKGISSIYHPSVMMRAATLRQIGGYREGTCPCEDFDLWLRLGEVGQLENLPVPLLIWRRTTAGIVASKQQRMNEIISRVLTDAWRRRRLPGDPPRPTLEVLSRQDLMRQWGWGALKNGHRRTAWKYALKGLAGEPTSMASWRLAACVIRGR